MCPPKPVPPQRWAARCTCVLELGFLAQVPLGSAAALQGAVTRRACLLGCKYALEGWKWKGCMAQYGPAMHGMILAVRTSEAVLALSKGSVTLSTPPVDAWEGHGVTCPQHTQPLGFVALGCHETYGNAFACRCPRGRLFLC